MKESWLMRSGSRASSMKSRKRAFEGNGAIDLAKEVVELSSDDSDADEKKVLRGKEKGKEKQVVKQDVIDVENDDGLPDNKVKLGGNYKGKDLIYVSDRDDCDDKKELYFEEQSFSSMNAGTSGLLFDKYSNNLSNVSSPVYQDNYIYFDQDDDLEYQHQDWSGVDELSYIQAQFEKEDFPTGVEMFIPWWSEPGQNNGQPINFSGPSYSSPNSDWPILGSGLYPLNHSHDSSSVKGRSSSAGFDSTNGTKSEPPKHGSLPEVLASRSSSLAAPEIMSEEGSGTSSAMSLHEDAMKRLQQFDNFAVVDDYSDHHYTPKSLKTQPRSAWAKKIQDEWKILKSSLPDTIFVRAYESKMDLLRAVIIGPQGTPYHDGLFFFDVLFPSSYPHGPPHVYYHSGGLRLNPNLYDCGKVCLSLLGTWSGQSATENWIPGKSTLLQVLVSIQALILNAKPYFNEPGYASYEGSTRGERASEKYNEETLIKSLKTMLYSMRRPPKHFEAFVSDHFVTRSHDILLACKAYIDGAQVGSISVVEGNAVRGNNKSCSRALKDNIEMILNSLIDEFSKLGVKNCERFRIPEPKKNEPTVNSGGSLSFKSQSQNKQNSDKAKISKAKLKKGRYYMNAPFPPALGVMHPVSLPSVAWTSPPTAWNSTPAPWNSSPAPWNSSTVPLNSSTALWNSSSVVHASPANMFHFPQPAMPNALNNHLTGIHNYSTQIPSIPDLSGNVYKWSDV